MDEIMKIENNTVLKGVKFESGFGGRGGSNCSDGWIERSVTLLAKDMENKPVVSFDPYGVTYLDSSDERIVIRGMYNDEVHLTIGKNEVILNKKKNRTGNTLDGVAYDTYAFFSLEAIFEE